MKKVVIHIFILYVVGMLVGCSVTPNLPEGEFLYTGIDKVKVQDLMERCWVALMPEALSNWVFGHITLLLTSHERA